MDTLNFSISTIFSISLIPTVVESWFIPFSLVTILSHILTILLDCLFLSIIILDKACHTVPMILIANTFLSQLLCAINGIFMNIFTLQNDLQHFQYQDSFCIIRGYFSYVTVAMMTYSFLLQASYRCITAVYPSRLFWQSPRTQILLICALWIFCLIFPLAFLFTGNITYNVNNQMCQIPLGLTFPMIYLAFFVYISPMSIMIYLYLRLVRYVKVMNNRVTPANVLSRAQRELKMIQQTIILVSILLTFGVPYALFILISFFTNPPKYHFRIAYIFMETSLPFLPITLFHFTDPLKVFVKRLLHRRTNVVVARVA